jgi:hypothetical protein
MKKIYSFLTAVLATFAINAQTTTELTAYAYAGTYNSTTYDTTWSDDYATLTEQAILENGVITFTNFLGSGQKISFTCYSDGSAEIVDPAGTYVSGSYSIGSLGTFTSLYFANNSNVTIEYYDNEKYGKGFDFTTWGYGDADKLYFEVELPDDFEPAEAPEKNIDPRYQSVNFYLSYYKTVNALLYGDKLRVDLGKDVLDFTIVTDGSGSKSVVYNGEPGYKYDADGDYYYFYAGSTYYGYTNTYIWAQIYDGSNYQYIYIYLPTDEWADVTEYDAISYTYGYTSNSYSSGTLDPWYTATTTTKTKWNLDKGQLLIPDYLGSKQDLLIVFDDNSIKSLWSLSDVWYSEYNGWYDDSDEDPVTFYPWFDTVNKSNEHYIDLGYSTQSLKVYNNIALSTYTYYTSDSNRVSQYEATYIVKPAGVTGVNNITVDESSDAPVEYYNLQGVRVANPQGGLFIKRQGNKASKVIIK